MITPNPLTSGGARWNVMAAYGAQRKLGKTHRQATDYLLKLFRHVTVQDKSARESLQTFASGKGDVLIAYENEAILAQQKDQPLDYVTKGAAPAAQDFVDFLRSPEAQRVFGEAGYRPVVDPVAAEFDFHEPPNLFTIEDVGG